MRNFKRSVLLFLSGAILPVTATISGCPLGQAFCKTFDAFGDVCVVVQDSESPETPSND